MNTGNGGNSGSSHDPAQLPELRTFKVYRVGEIEPIVVEHHAFSVEQDSEGWLSVSFSDFTPFVGGNVAALTRRVFTKIREVEEVVISVPRSRLFH